jgi:hypothetical protein
VSLCVAPAKKCEKSAKKEERAVYFLYTLNLTKRSIMNNRNEQAAENEEPPFVSGSQADIIWQADSASNNLTQPDDVRSARLGLGARPINTTQSTGFAPYPDAPQFGGAGEMQPIPPKKQQTGLGIAALVLGIVALLGCWIPVFNIASIIIAVVGIILGIVGIVITSKDKLKSPVLAIVGTSLSAFAVIVAIIVTILIFPQIYKDVEASITPYSDNTQEILANEVGVDFGKFTATDDGHGFFATKLPVTVTNKLDLPTEFSFVVNAEDPSTGDVIDTDYLFVSTLKYNQSQSEDLFTYVDSSKIDKMKNAKFVVAKANRTTDVPTDSSSDSSS